MGFTHGNVTFVHTAALVTKYTPEVLLGEGLTILGKMKNKECDM